MQEAADKASEQLRKDELLILAASTGFISEVKQLISEGASVHCTDKEGKPLLHFPAAKGKLDVINLLISKGCDLDCEDKQGRTALHYACSENAHEVVKLLIKSGTWLDTYDINDDTALHLAIRGNHVQCVKQLIMGGAQTSIINNRGLTALGEAISSKKLEIVEYLLNKGADVNRVSKGYSLLHLAAGVGDVEILQLLLQYLSPDKVVHPGGVTPLHCASLKHVPPSVIELLIEHGSDPRTVDNDGRTAYDWAKGDGNDNEQVLKMLKVENKGRKGRRRKPTVTEIEPADSPENEWATFQEMSHEDKLKQVEVWARSKEEYLSGLAFLNEDSRKAVAAVGNFMRMLECQIAIERLKQDEDFRQNAADEEVQKAVAECAENPKNIRKYSSNEKVKNVLIKLKRLDEVLRRNGKMRFVYEELIGGSSNSAKDEFITIEKIEESLAMAKEAVVKAVIGNSNAQKRTEEGTSWWNKDSSAFVDPNGDTPRLGTWNCTRTLVFQFLRQFLVAFLICSAMVLAMYFTDSLPAQNPRYSTHEGADDGIMHPAHVTDDKSIHQRFQTKDFHAEL
eukprot:g1237.t1